MNHLKIPAVARLPLSPAWHERLATAATERDIVMATREYLVEWTPRELGILPEDCRPGRIVDGEDVSHWAFHLTQSHLDGALSAEAERLLRRLHAFFTHAATRLAELARERRHEAEGDDGGV
jgi:hypothetical protein